MNLYGQKRVPFLFIINFDATEFELFRLDSLPKDVIFSINQITIPKREILLQKNLIDFQTYKRVFELVIKEIEAGNSYLLNLTFSTPIQTDASLLEIYQNANALFKLYFKDQFVCFSPERFVEIKENSIYTYPMKGTIDANIKNAKELILNDKKEMAEHVMVVDLLRNDLGIVAREIRVEEFRYISEIKSPKKRLYQVSSRISGKLEDGWQKRVGEIVSLLLPAGSVSGTPKKRSCEIIKSVELHKRGWFCGVFGVFYGDSLDSGVMIRFIEQTKDGLVYKSGGGITIDSDPLKEYKELEEKIYVPIL